MPLKCLYMFVDPSADPSKHRAVIETPSVEMTFVGVTSVEDGAELARQFVEEGVALVELCGGFGYAGAKRIHDEIGEKVPVGMTVHQVWNAQNLMKMLGGE